MSEDLFQKELDQATTRTDCGIYVFRNFLESDPESEWENFDNDEFPWDLKPRIFGERLDQHAYLYKRTDRELQKSPALRRLEELCESLEDRFGGEISDVFCNRFVDPSHGIDWHKDTYGTHIFVLSLGSPGRIEFRHNKTNEIEEVLPEAGDLYFMPLRLNETHKHRVSRVDEGPRISMVFFWSPPKYAKDFQITRGQRVRGFFTGVLEGWN